jgi:excisionase family DNA binding protein
MDTPPTDTANKLLLTVEEAARRLSICRAHLYGFLLSGEIQSVCLGRSRRIPVAALEAFIARLEGEQANIGREL